jgi:hypothetical protein
MSKRSIRLLTLPAACRFSSNQHFRMVERRVLTRLAARIESGSNRADGRGVVLCSPASGSYWARVMAQMRSENAWAKK